MYTAEYLELLIVFTSTLILLRFAISETALCVFLIHRTPQPNILMVQVLTMENG